jgi:hypothetical protein
MPRIPPEPPRPERAAADTEGPPLEMPEPPPRLGLGRRAPQLIEPPLPPTEDTPAPPSGSGLTFAWVVSILLLAGFVMSLWLFRDEVVRAWPAAARLYMALGLLPNG